jgi:hypothetical protein
VLLSLLSPEAQLLFLSASDKAKDSDLHTLLKGKLDWLELCWIAEREKAIPLVWRRIEGVAGDSIPSEPAAHLRKFARVITFRMSYLEQLVTASTASLDGAGIQYSLLKGAALACAAYGSFEDRPMVDVDILVRETDANDAVDALLSTGWIWRADKDRQGNFSHLHHLPALIDPHGLVSAEIHTSILPQAAPFTLTSDEVFRSTRLVPFRNATVSVPDPVYLLLHACIHFTWSHLFRSGAWRTFRDVQRLINSYPLDWDRFIELARLHRADTCCFWTLHLARELISADVPPEVLAALRPPLPAIVLRALERHFVLILVPSGTLCPSVRLRRAFWTAGILPRYYNHGASRPWKALALRIEDRPAREKTRDAEVHRRARTAGRNWAQYWASVLLATPAHQ